MSWLFSRALVEAYSEDTCLVGARSAPSNENLTPQLFLPLDKMKGFSRLSRFGMTFAPLTESRGADVLTWFLEGFPAKTSARLAGVPVSKENALGSGVKWLESSVRYDRDTCSWKTHPSSSNEVLPWSSVTLPKWGTMRSGLVFRHPTSERPISVTVSGLWPTPVAQPANGTPERFLQRKRDWVAKGSSMGIHLSDLQLAVVASELGMQARGYLNPKWVEWMMGWPLGWTALKPLETDKYRQWRRWHSSYCPVAANDNSPPSDDADWDEWRAYVLS